MTIECPFCGYFWVEEDSKCPRCWYFSEEQKTNSALKLIKSDPEITWDRDGTITTDVLHLIKMLSNSAV